MFKSVFIAMSLIFLTTQVQAQVTPIQQLEVQDSLGTVMGTAHFPSAGNRGEIAVLFEVEGQVMSIRLEPQGFREPEETLGFESLDCTGAGFLFTGDAPSLFALSSVVPPGNTLWIQDDNAVDTLVTIQSTLRRGDVSEDNPSGCNTLYFPTFAKPAHVVADLDARFTAPFHLVAVPFAEGNVVASLVKPIRPPKAVKKAKAKRR